MTIQRSITTLSDLANSKSPSVRQAYGSLQAEMNKYANPGIRTGAILQGGGLGNLAQDYQKASVRDNPFYQPLALDPAKQTLTYNLPRDDFSFSTTSQWDLSQIQEIINGNATQKLKDTALAMQVNRLFQDLKDTVQGHSTKNGQRRLNQFLVSLEAL